MKKHQATASMCPTPGGADYERSIVLVVLTFSTVAVLAFLSMLPGIIAKRLKQFAWLCPSPDSAVRV